jgi:hypothetical protein
MSAPRVRATIVVDVDKPGQVRAVEGWFAAWRDKLTYVSEDQGCGCCVNIWDVEGPAAAIEQIPSDTRALSEWAGVDSDGRTQRTGDESDGESG